MGAKKAVNISLDAELIAEARAHGYNLSAVCAEAIAAKNRAERAAKWRKENRGAVEAWNAWVEANGIPFDDLRPW